MCVEFWKIILSKLLGEQDLIGFSRSPSYRCEFSHMAAEGGLIFRLQFERRRLSGCGELFSVVSAEFSEEAPFEIISMDVAVEKQHKTVSESIQ